MILRDLVVHFISYLLTEKRVSENTFIAYKQDLMQFQFFCKKTELIDTDHINQKALSNFLVFLKDQGLGARSIARKIAAIKGLFVYASQRYGLQNFSKDLVIPKLKKGLPGYLSLEEVEKLFEKAQEDTSLIGSRNKTMLYLMYVAGLRVSELISLRIAHIHRDTAMVAIEGKRGRQRLVPLPDRMVQELCIYIDNVRPVLLRGYGASDYLFPVIYGKKVKALTRQAFWVIVKQIWKTTAINRHISPHVLRHSFATHMLEKGANLRSLQMLLGHEQLTTVQIYTHIETSQLRAIYDKKHPRS